MPAFSRPKPDFNYDLIVEKNNIDKWINHRNVPKKEANKLLFASWNIANLGEQKRLSNDLKLIAHLLSKFDLIAVQEIKNNYQKFEELAGLMTGYDYIMSDTAGNNERLGFLYDTKKVSLGKLFAEVAIARKDFPRLSVYVPYTFRKENRVEVFYDLEFIPFDRNPFLGTFKAGNLDFTVANVHLYFGAYKDSRTTEERAKYARRVLEIYTLSKWVQKRLRSDFTYDKDIIVVGDMNVPEMNKSDDAYKALLKSGLLPTDYFSKTGGSNLGGSKSYDQLALAKGNLQHRIINFDVFDFDNGIFSGLWDKLNNEEMSEVKKVSKFNAYTKAYISDHRPLWIQLDIT